MNIEKFRDEWCQITCGDCEYFNIRADLDGVVSTCKRLDHKHLKFAKPWFKSYDCGQSRLASCSDFKYGGVSPILKKQFPLVGIDKYLTDKQKYDGYVWLVVDNDTSIRYAVNRKDFYNNTFLTDSGNLKWIKREYYKRSNRLRWGIN